MEHQQNEICIQRFEHIESRLADGDRKMDELTTSLQRTEINLAKVSTALGGVAKALWAVVGIVGSALVGFFIWFVQSH